MYFRQCHLTQADLELTMYLRIYDLDLQIPSTGIIGTHAPSSLGRAVPSMEPRAHSLYAQQSLHAVKIYSRVWRLIESELLGWRWLERQSPTPTPIHQPIRSFSPCCESRWLLNSYMWTSLTRAFLASVGISASCLAPLCPFLSLYHTWLIFKNSGHVLGFQNFTANYKSDSHFSKWKRERGGRGGEERRGEEGFVVRICLGS